MNRVYELQSDTLVKLSKEIFSTLDYPLEFIKGSAIWEIFDLPEESIARAKQECPIISGKCSCLFLLPNNHAPIHVDNHDGGNYHRSLNILVEDNNSNHKTFYYEYDGVWDMNKQGAIYSWDYDKDDPKIKRSFELKVTTPVIFWNQQFHNIENYDGNRRVTFMWGIHKDVSDEQIISWLENAGIKYNVLY